LASEFVRKLSAVYRYVLNQKEKKLGALVWGDCFS
jgi:hypothetical protein